MAGSSVGELEASEQVEGQAGMRMGYEVLTAVDTKCMVRFVDEVQGTSACSLVLEDNAVVRSKAVAG